MDNPRILVVDDEPSLRLLNCLVLNSLGFMNLCEAKDGEEALGLVHLQEFALVISDVSMPNLDGFGLLDGMRRLGILSRTKVIMVTGEKRAEDKLLAGNLGASAYLLKPVNKEELRQAILNALG